jgi:hypothetical protein
VEKVFAGGQWCADIYPTMLVGFKNFWIGNRGIN